MTITACQPDCDIYGEPLIMFTLAELERLSEALLDRGSCDCRLRAAVIGVIHELHYRVWPDDLCGPRISEKAIDQIRYRLQQAMRMNERATQTVIGRWIKGFAR